MAAAAAAAGPSADAAATLVAAVEDTRSPGAACVQAASVEAAPLEAPSVDDALVVDSFTAINSTTGGDLVSADGTGGDLGAELCSTPPSAAFRLGRVNFMGMRLV